MRIYFEEISIKATKRWVDDNGHSRDLCRIPFINFRRRPAKHNRPMTRWEVLVWANSEESRGWVVQAQGNKMWYIPQFFSYDTDTAKYRRARLLPDNSGIDESTIRGFEVEE
jgi:hypothetical protein